MIGIESIERRIAGLSHNLTIDNVVLQARQAKMEIAEMKHELEIAKNRDYLRMVELSYDLDDRQDFRDAFIFEIGFKMPGFHEDREALNSRKLKYLQEKLRYAEEKREIREKVHSLFRSLKRLIEQYKILFSRKDNSNASASFQTFMSMDGADPLNLLKLKESLLKSDLQLNKVVYEIRSKYIDLIYHTGMLVAEPLKNHLVADANALSEGEHQ